MKCPHCESEVTDRVPSCPSCDFDISDLDDSLGEPPPRADGIADAAGVLDADWKQRIRDRVARFQERTGAELMVVTTETSQPVRPRERAFWLFNRWKIGGDTNRGLLVHLSLEEHRLDCEVGYSLEEIVTDDESSDFLQRHAAPALAKGKLGAGLHTAVNVLAELVESSLQPSSRWALWIGRKR